MASRRMTASFGSVLYLQIVVPELQWRGECPGPSDLGSRFNWNLQTLICMQIPQTYDEDDRGPGLVKHSGRIGLFLTDSHLSPPSDLFTLVRGSIAPAKIDN